MVDPFLEECKKFVIDDKEIFRRYYAARVWCLQQDGKDYKIKLTEDDNDIIKIIIEDRCYDSG